MNTEAMMQMSPWDFDQSPDGWRKLDGMKEYIKAAGLIEEYIAKNQDRIVHPESLYFHIGQLLAHAGPEHRQKAIQALNHSFRKSSESWNAYVSATIGFLENDIQKIYDALAAIQASPEQDKRSGNVGIVKNLKKALGMGERDYATVYLWPTD